MKEEEKKQLESLISKLMQSIKIPSMVINVIQDGKEIYSRAFGSKLLKENIPATENTIYGIGSVSKSFTCLAIMQLVEKGKLKVDDPVNKYLQFELGKKDKPITIHHLMSHSSGIPNLGIANVLISRFSNLKETYIPLSNTDDMLLYLNNAKEEVIDEPGKRFFYFNAGYVLLGMIIEKLSGMKFHEYVKENIFKPLEMKTACFTKEEFEKAKDKMTAYKVDKEDLEETIHPFDEFIYAAGGILCSAKELTNYLQMYLNNGKFNGKQLVSKESIEKMLTPIIKANLRGSNKIFYSYGWSIDESLLGEKIISHGGSTAVSSANVSLMPSRKIGVAIVANCGNSQSTLISNAILSYLVDKNPMKEIPELVLDNKLDLLAGKYKTYRGLAEIEIVKKGLFLYMKQSDKETIDYHLVPKNLNESNYQFYIPNGITNYPVEFLVNKKKSKITLIFERNAFHKS